MGGHVEHELTPNDYLKMREINRKVLSEFVNVQNEVARNKLSDTELDERFKVILQKGSNGHQMKAEIVAHLEYFFNTLNIDHKNRSENPFDKPEDYPALNHKIGKIGADIIMESQETSSEDENTGTGRPIISDNDLIDHS